MLRSAAGLAMLALVTGCGLGVQYPEFANTAYRIEGDAAAPTGGAPVHTVIYRDGPKMRVETLVAGGQAATIVFNEATDAAYLLTDPATVPAQPSLQSSAQPSGTTRTVTTTSPAPESAPGATPPAQQSTVTTALAPTQTAANTPPAAAAPAATTVTTGVAVRVADDDAPKPIEAPWAALDKDDVQRVGDCIVAGENGHEWRPRSNTQIVRTACITNDGIVLRVRENERVIFQATGLQRGPQPARLFGIPAGYQIIDPEAISRQVGDTMEQLDSVTGGAKQPAPAAQATPRSNPG